MTEKWKLHGEIHKNGVLTKIKTGISQFQKQHGGALDIDHPCAEPWTEPSKYQEDPEFAAFAIPEPVPTVKKEVYRAYSVDRPYQEPPKMPVPYTTLAETFSYGI